MNRFYRVKCLENGWELKFDSKREIKVWASRATITLGSNLTLEVCEIVEREFQMVASYETGVVSER